VAGRADVAGVCAGVHAFAWALARHRFPFDASALPRNGIYLLFEAGEGGHGGERIVRVGTHTGAGQLSSRLKQHFVAPNKDRSIFRKNIGRALLACDGDPFLEHWEIDRTTRSARDRWAGRIDEDKQARTEARVSERIQRWFSFAVLEVSDKGDRLAWEAALIGTVNACPACGASSQWLGRWSPKAKIRESGLWLVNGLASEPLAAATLAKLERLAA